MLLTDYAKKNIVWSVICVTVTLIFVLPMYFFTNWSLSDIFIPPTALFLGYVSLRWIARFGTFDLFSYQMINWANTTFRKGTPKKYQDAYTYEMQMKAKREENKMVFLPFLCVGILCLILCLVFSFFPTLGR